MKPKFSAIVVGLLAGVGYYCCVQVFGIRTGQDPIIVLRYVAQWCAGNQRHDGQLGYSFVGVVLSLRDCVWLDNAFFFLVLPNSRKAVGLFMGCSMEL